MCRVLLGFVFTIVSVVAFSAWAKGEYATDCEQFEVDERIKFPVRLSFEERNTILDRTIERTYDVGDQLFPENISAWRWRARGDALIARFKELRENRWARYKADLLHIPVLGGDGFAPLFLDPTNKDLEAVRTFGLTGDTSGLISWRLIKEIDHPDVLKKRREALFLSFENCAHVMEALFGLHVNVELLEYLHKKRIENHLENQSWLGKLAWEFGQMTMAYKGIEIQAAVLAMFRRRGSGGLIFRPVTIRTPVTLNMVKRGDVWVWERVAGPAGASTATASSPAHSVQPVVSSLVASRGFRLPEGTRIGPSTGGSTGSSPPPPSPRPVDQPIVGFQVRTPEIPPAEPSRSPNVTAFDPNREIPLDRRSYNPLFTERGSSGPTPFRRSQSRTAERTRTNTQTPPRTDEPVDLRMPVPENLPVVAVGGRSSSPVARSQNNGPSSQHYMGGSSPSLITALAQDEDGGDNGDNDQDNVIPFPLPLNSGRTSDPSRSGRSGNSGSSRSDDDTDETYAEWVRQVLHRAASSIKRNFYETSNSEEISLPTILRLCFTTGIEEAEAIGEGHFTNDERAQLTSAIDEAVTNHTSEPVARLLSQWLSSDLSSHARIRIRRFARQANKGIDNFNRAAKTLSEAKVGKLALGQHFQSEYADVPVVHSALSLAQTLKAIGVSGRIISAVCSDLRIKGVNSHVVALSRNDEFEEEDDDDPVKVELIDPQYFIPGERYFEVAAVYEPSSSSLGARALAVAMGALRVLSRGLSRAPGGGQNVLDQERRALASKLNGFFGFPVFEIQDPIREMGDIVDFFQTELERRGLASRVEISVGIAETSLQSRVIEIAPQDSQWSVSLDVEEPVLRIPVDVFQPDRLTITKDYYIDDEDEFALTNTIFYFHFLMARSAQFRKAAHTLLEFNLNLNKAGYGIRHDNEEWGTIEIRGIDNPNSMPLHYKMGPFHHDGRGRTRSSFLDWPGKVQDAFEGSFPHEYSALSAAMRIVDELEKLRDHPDSYGGYVEFAFRWEDEISRRTRVAALELLSPRVKRMWLKLVEAQRATE